MHTFLMRHAKYFYDKQLPKYLDPKTVLIYRPHPVYAEDLDKTMEVLEAKLPKFFSGLGNLHRELGSNQQDVRNRNIVTHSYSPLTLNCF